jgi:pyruvate,water dikinase
VPDGVVVLPDAFVEGALRPEAWREVLAWASSLPVGRAGPPALAVRSSALNEDSAQASFAGAFETVLDVRGEAPLARAIQAVYASQSAHRVRAYSSAMSVSAPAAEQIGMAVLIQRMVPAEFAGVLFTADPVSGDRARMLGNFVRGLGERLVSGEADAESFTLAQPNGAYAGPAELRPMARRLFQLGQRLEVDLGTPQDIEWAIAGGRLALLQARPITTLRAHDPATGDWNSSWSGRYLWTNTNYGEAIPDVMTPATWSAVQLFMRALLPPQPTANPHPFIGNIGGRFYFNVSLVAAVFRALGFNQARLQHEMEELYGRVPPGLEVPHLPLARLALLARLLPFGVRAKRRVTADRPRLPAYLAQAPAQAAALRAQIDAARTPQALGALWTNTLLPAFMRSAQFLQAGTSFYENTFRPLRHALLKQVGLEETNALLSGVSQDGQPLASLGPIVGLWRVTQGQLSREAFAAEQGHRGPHEFELAWPRPAEDPAWLDRQLDDFQRNPVPLGIPALLARQQAVHAAAWQRYAARFPRQAASTRRQLDTAAAAARAREGTRSELTRMFGVLRAFGLRAGALTGLGADIFFLSLDEIAGVLNGDLSPLPALPARRETHARYSALPAYPAVIRGRFDPFTWAADPQRRSDLYDDQPAARHTTARGDTLTGYAGAAGLVEGTVRVLQSVDEGPWLQRGEILVAATTNIGWTPLFPRALAVVTDVGAPLSHAAIVARELGIPAVVGTGQATMRLRTGDRVRVNGGLGTVEILE